jgi:hypothetical protein
MTSKQPPVLIAALCNLTAVFGNLTAVDSPWGAGLSPRGALAPLPCPSTRPTKLLRRGSQSRLYRIPFNVPLDPTKLTVVTDHAIKELVLPEFLPTSSQRPVGQESGRTFHSPDEFWQRNNRSTQHVDMIRHDNEGMQSTVTVRTGLSQLLLYYPRDLRLPQIKRTSTSEVEQPVPGQERFSGSQVFPLKYTVWGKAAPETPREKCRHSRSVDVRQAAAITAHLIWCGETAMILRQSSGAEAPRGLKPAPQRVTLPCQ